VLARGGEDRQFIDTHTEGFQAFAGQIETTAWSDIEAAAGIGREAIADAAEANALVPRSVDPRSKTPAFKSVLVQIVPESA
jgi:anaerobic selenocysteine-containing dehydrogenase